MGYTPLCFLFNITYPKKSSCTLSLSKVLWISLFKVGISHGLIIRILHYGLELRIFLSLASGRSSSQMLFGADYQEFCQITFLDEIEEQRLLLSIEKLRKDVATIELEMTILWEKVSRIKSRGHYG
jgi:hypothetical protein